MDDEEDPQDDREYDAGRDGGGCNCPDVAGITKILFGKGVRAKNPSDACIEKCIKSYILIKKQSFI